MHLGPGLLFDLLGLLRLTMQGISKALHPFARDCDLPCASCMHRSLRRRGLRAPILLRCRARASSCQTRRRSHCLPCLHEYPPPATMEEWWLTLVRTPIVEPMRLRILGRRGWGRCAMRDVLLPGLPSKRLLLPRVAVRVHRRLAVPLPGRRVMLSMMMMIVVMAVFVTGGAVQSGRL